MAWKIDHGPVFDNCIGQLTFDGDRAQVRIESAKQVDDETTALEVVFETVLSSRRD